MSKYRDRRCVPSVTIGATVLSASLEELWYCGRNGKVYLNPVAKMIASIPSMICAPPGGDQ